MIQWACPSNYEVCSRKYAINEGKTMLNIKQGLRYIVLAAGITVGALGCGDDDQSGDGGIFRIDSGRQEYVDCGERTLSDILSDERHCGGCDITCDPSAYCVEGSCEVFMMDAGVECDESQLELDRYNCGACGNECLPVQGCRDGECLYAGYYEDDNVCDIDMPDCAEGLVCKTPDDWEISYCMEPARFPCEFDSECIEENNLCLVGYCTLVVPEVCNNKDDNRNGFVDEDLIMGMCYPDFFPPETEGVGSCRPGVNFCIEGSWDACIGYVGPVPEEGILACDGIDNDCNGCPDNMYDADGICIPPEPRLFDIVMMLDVSTSMMGEIAAATEAIGRIGGPFFGDPTKLFALLTFTYPLADPVTGIMDPDTRIGSRTYWGNPDRAVVQSLAPFSAFTSALSMVSYTGFGNEQTYDVMYLAASGGLPSLRLRPTSTRIYILFTDEAPGTYSTAPHTEASACAPYDARPQDVFLVVTPTRFQASYPCADLVRAPSDDPAVVAQDILDILETVCE